MYGVELLMKEHENIKRMADVLRTASLHVLNGGNLVVEDFDQMKAFVRNYADDHHHRKEENILFSYMKKELGSVAEKLITQGMMVEHDLGRLHMMKLEDALRVYEKVQSLDAKLDVIVNATAYSDLIYRHIEKEDTVVFSFGEKNLKEEIRKLVDIETWDAEEQATKEGLQKKYITILTRLEEKYRK